MLFQVSDDGLCLDHQTMQFDNSKIFLHKKGPFFVEDISGSLGESS